MTELDGYDAIHLRFVDETKGFCDYDYGQMVNFRCVFTLFEAVLGLRANFAKSFILPVGQVRNILLLVSALGCTIDSPLTAYLALHCGVRYEGKSIWDPIIDRFEKRLLPQKSKIPIDLNIKASSLL